MFMCKNIAYYSYVSNVKNWKWVCAIKMNNLHDKTKLTDSHYVLKNKLSLLYLTVSLKT